MTGPDADLRTAARDRLTASISAGMLPARPSTETIITIADLVSATTLETAKASSFRLDALDDDGGSTSAPNAA